MAIVIQPSFAKGELSPDLYGRVDTSIYRVGLRKAENAIVHVTGGVSNRPGLMFIGPVKTHSESPALLPFKFKTSDTYILEFGAAYMRAIRNDGHVLNGTLAISGATQANPVVVTHAAGTYANGDEIYIEGVVGMTELNGRRFVAANVTATTMELTDQVTGSNIDGTAFTAYSSGGTVASVFELTTPYAIDDVDTIAWAQSADVMTLVHPSYTARELTRTDHNAWTLAEITFAPEITHPVTISVSVNTTGSETDLYTVTAWDADGKEESLPGESTAAATITGATQADPVVITTSAAHGYEDDDEVFIESVVGMTEINDRRFIVANKTATTFELRDEDGTGHTAYSSGGTSKSTFVRVTNSNTTRDNTIAWARKNAASKYSVYRFKNGVFGWIGDTEKLSFDDENIDPDVSISPPGARNPFNAADDYPRAVAYYEQRRVFGGTNNKPDTTFYSQTGNHSNMNVSSPVRADDAITATLNAEEVNEIRFFSPGDDLLIFTSGSEWKINSGGDAGFAPDTINQKPQSNHGIANLRPVKVGDVILFVDEQQKSVRSFGFTLEFEKYTGSDMTQLAKHIFEHHTIDDWAHAKRPENWIYAVRSDGQLGCLAFDREQEVVAWTRWKTFNGKFEKVAVVRPSASDTFEAPYFVVKRTINGNTVRYIERASERRFENVQDAFFVDCGLTLDNPITITGVTAADPVVVTTSAAHGLSNGDEVDISDIVWTPQFDDDDNETQPDQLNGGRFTIANVTATTMELQRPSGTDVDGSGFAAYVEGGKVREAVTEISGLRHLIGETVSILANGNVVSGKTVSATGTVTLSEKASRVHVGLKIITNIETLDLNVPNTLIQGRPVAIGRITFRFKDSRGMLFGPNSNQLDELKQREFERYGEPTDLLTGDKEVSLDASWDDKGRIYLRQRDPLPVTLLAVLPDVDVGDDDD